MPPPPGAESCFSTCVYCDFNGYTGTNNGTPSGGNQVCGQISLHNDQWFGFIAGTTDISIDISTWDCVTGNGLQTAFFDACSNDALVCNPGSSGGGGNPLPLSYSGFVPGQTYYLMLDGWSGDVCDFQISVTGGSITPPPVEPVQPIEGCAVVCPGAECVYTIPAVVGAGAYLWTAPPGSMINGAGSSLNIPANAGGTQVTVTFGSAPGNICVTASNACSAPQKICMAVMNQPVPPTTLAQFVICANELPWEWPEEPFPVLVSPGVYNLTSTPYDNWLGCDSLVKQKIIVKQTPITNLGTYFICENSCFNYNSQDYCSGGSYEVMYLTPSGCDSTVRFNIIQAPVAAVISPAAPVIDCTNPTIQLTNQGSAGNQFFWYNSNWQIIQNGPTTTVSALGTYYLVVSNQVGNALCKDTASVVVTANGVLPTASASGGAISCLPNAQNVSLSGNSNLPTAAYSWTGPGITPLNMNQQNPSVNVGGTYNLIVTNPANGCTATATATVSTNIDVPAISAAGGTLTCSQTSVQINLNSNIGNANFVWTGAGINGSNQNQQNPTVNVPDSYSVVATNPTNGCTASTSVTVDQFNVAPQVSVSPDQTINCQNPGATITGSTNYTTGIICVWNFPNGQTSSQPTIVATSPGTYVFVVTNNLNGCIGTATVTISSDIVNPSVEAGVPQTLTCTQTSVVLNGSGSSGANFIPIWSGPGITPANQNQISPTVSVNGTYTLIIANSLNGCTASDQVVVNLDIFAPTANAGFDKLISCTSQNGATLSGSGTPAGGVNFSWSGPGIGANNADQQTPNVTQSGTYVLVVTNTSNGCTATDDVVVTKDANIPDAVAGQDLTINCAVNSVNLSGTGSTSGAGVQYSWAGPNGFFSNLLDPTQNITEPGDYILTVLNSNNNCQNTDVQTIILDKKLPDVFAGIDGVLNCFNNATDTLDASNSSAGANFSLVWSGPGITPGTATLTNPIVNQPGTYLLSVINSDNQCSASASVQVISDLIPPTAAAGLDKEIDCVITSIGIGGNSSTGADFTYLWTGAGISQINNSIKNPTVSQPGNYSVVVTDNSNGCTSTDEMTLVLDAVYPVAEAGLPTTLTCLQPNSNIGSLTTSTGANIQILWSGAGISPANANQSQPNIDQPGIYILTVSNTSNSCKSIDTVEILESKILPAVAAGLDQSLDCQKVTAILDGSGSATGADISYSWTGAGITPATQNLQSPPVNQPGNYTLVVTNNSNGCTDEADVLISQNIAPPTANAGSTFTLTCAQNTQAIDGNGSSAGSNFAYFWQGPGINSINQTLQNPMVSDSGTYLLTVTDLTNKCTATASVLVALNGNFPAVEAGAGITLTCKNDTLALDASQSASGAGITYSWAGPGIVAGQANLQNPQVFVPGIYTLVVTDTNNGCSKTDATTAIENKISPIAEANLDLILTCAANSVSLSSAGSSSANVQFLWAGPGIDQTNQNSPNPTVTSPGDYSLVVTDLLNGCTADDAMKVALDQGIPEVQAGADKLLTCDILDAILDGTANSNSPGALLFLWSGPGINPANKNEEQPNISLSGTYTLVVTNSTTNCSASDVIIVNEDKAKPDVTATADEIDCADPIANFTTTTTATVPIFSWEGPGINGGNKTKQHPNVTEAGIYVVTVTDQNGCTGTTSFTVTQDADFPIGNAEGCLLNCLNNGMDSLISSVTTPGATFAWTGPSGFSSNLQNPQVTAGGNYFFKITAPNGCTKNIQVLVETDFEEPKAAASVTEKIDCNSPEVKLDGTGSSVGSDFEYLWTGPAVIGTGNLQPEAAKAGTYQILVTNTKNGCTATADVEVENDPEVPTGFNLGLQNIRCFGEKNGTITVESIVGGTSPYLYSINGDAPTSSNQFTFLAAGQYELTLFDINGCRIDTLVTISEPQQLTVELGDDVKLQLGDSTLVAAQIFSGEPLKQIFWTPAAPCDSTCFEFWAKPFSSKLYEITVVDSNGCKSSDEKLIEVVDNKQIFVANIFNPNLSDFNGVLMVQASTRAITKVKSFLIFDRWGEAVFEVHDFQPNDVQYAWDGKVKGKLANPSVFVWYAEVEFVDGETVVFKGDVLLKL